MRPLSGAFLAIGLVSCVYLNAQQQSPTAAQRYQDGVDLMAQHKYAEAQKAFRDAQAIRDDQQLGPMRLKQAQPDDGLKQLQDQVDQNPERIDLRLRLGKQMVLFGRYDEALAIFQDALSRVGPESKPAADIYLSLGDLYRRQGELETAVIHLRRAVEIRPDDAPALFSLASTLELAGNAAEAWQVYRTLLAVQPENGVAMNNLAYLIADSGGDLDEAMTLAERARKLLPQLDEVSDTLGWIYLKQNLPAQAIPLLGKLVKAQPANPNYRFHLGMALQQNGDSAGAAEQFQAALKLNPPADLARKIRAVMQ
jgi:Flp pilus assembly protein TadD